MDLSKFSLTVFLLTSIIYAQVTTSTIIKDANYIKQENNYYKFSATLVSIYVPESNQNLKEEIETGKVDASQIINRFDFSPLPNSEIKIYSISPYDESIKELICTIKTDENGTGSCTGKISAATDREIRFVYDGDETHASTQYSIALVGSFSTPPLNEMVDASWLIIFLVIGVSIAALYASGRDPLSILDITTPKVKGIKSPKMQKIKLKGQGKIIGAASAALASTSMFMRNIYFRGNLNLSVLKTLNTAEKYMAPNEKKEMKGLYALSPVLATAKIAEKSADIRPRLIKMISSARRKLQSANKAKAKIEELKTKAKTEGEQWRIREMEKKIDQEIEKYTKQINEYERDLRAMSPESLIAAIGFNEADLDKFKEIKNTVDSKFVSSLIQYINNPRHAKLDLKEIKEYAVLSVDQIGIKDLEARDRLNSALLAKIELERLYIAEAIKILNIISNKYETLSGEEKSKYNKILNILEPEENRLKYIKELYKNPEIVKESIKQYSIDEYIAEIKKKIEKLSDESEEKKKIDAFIDNVKRKDREQQIEELTKFQMESNYVKLYDSFIYEIAKARNSIDSSINNFYSSYAEYAKKSQTEDVDQSGFKLLVEFGVLAKKSEDYLKDIYSGQVSYSRDYPELNREVAKHIFDMVTVKKDAEVNFDALYNAYISPLMNRETVDFAKQRILYFEDSKVGRTVFNRIFDDIWYQKIDPKEEYYNLDMKIIGYYGLNQALTKMETEKIILSGQPDCDGKQAALDYINYFIRTYGPHKLGYEEKKQIVYEKKKEIGHENKKLIGYEKKKEIGYEPKKLLDYKKEKSDSKNKNEDESE